MQARNKFSVNIKQLRADRNLTQAQLADDLIITRAALGAYEEDRARPGLDKLIAMADYFGITVDKLIR